MFLDKFIPQSGYSFSGVRLSKDKKHISPSPLRNQHIPASSSKRLSQKNDRRKRIMTEYDDEPEHRLGKSTAYPTKKTNLFLKDFEDITHIKASPNERFLSRFEKNNINAVKSTKNNEGRNMQLRSLYGPGKVKKGKPTRADSLQRPHISIMKLLKDQPRKSKYFINLNELENRSRNHSRSFSKGRKVEVHSLHKDDLDDLDKNRIQLEKREKHEREKQERSEKQEKVEGIEGKSAKQTDTVVTVKKNREEPPPVNKYDLTDEEFDVFGDRFPYGCEKIKLLGRGGFSLVWLGEHKRSSKLFAIKQIITENNHQTHMKQIWFGSKFFTLGGLPRPQFSKHPGIRNLAKMYSYQINQKDTWIFYQKCGSSLGNCLYDIRGYKHNGQKLYKIQYKPLYHQLVANPRLLKKIIIEIAKVLMLLSDNQIVHSDLKTQNILIKNDETDITQVKLIDYGSSFSFSQINQFSMATPEYMSHQILNYILCENDNEYDQELLLKVKNYRNPWVVDIWSLGCVLLEIINGVPLWMSLPLLVDVKGKLEKKFGLFAVKGRLFQQIIHKQVEVIENLDWYLTQENYSGIKPDAAIVKVLKGMLELEPEERMSPKKVVEILTASM